MYAKLFSSITESSLWSEPKEVRLLFVTMLAKADQTGFVEASVPGLARVANLAVEETIAALSVLQNPDPFSKNPDNDGRRIAVVPRGFMLLNYEDYRSRRNVAERQEYMREYMREYRKQSVNTVNRSEPPLAHTEADTEADTKKTQKKTRVPKTQSVPVAEFDEFWHIFPRKIAQGAAEKAWNTARKTVDAKKILDAALVYATSVADKDKKFVKHPATWLNAKCWNDELPPPAEKVCRWPYDDTDIHTPEGMALLTKTFLENQHRA